MIQPVALALALVVQAPTAPDPLKVLVFTRTTGFRHDSIPAGVEALRRTGPRDGLDILWTEDPAYFREDLLDPFACVVFLNTTGDILDEAQQQALEAFIHDGKGWVGIHAAADTEYEWPFYAGLVGAHFASHPEIQPATILVTDRTHPATRHLPHRWSRTDEWYNFKASPRGKVHVLAALDERSYSGGSLGHDHPIAWCHEYAGGRAFYTALGHTAASYAEPAYLRHIVQGIRWAAGAEPGDAYGTIDAAYEKTILDDDVLDPMELAVASDGRVFFVERGGAIKMWPPPSGPSEVVGFIPVNSKLEDGLLGIALDPAFDENGWAYLYYSPADPEPRNRLSRFTIDRNRLDPASESILLEVATQRDECCHSGGSVAFGPDGCLFVSTGDNTNPFASDGFAPIDEREGRSPWDAQKSSANPADLRGKVLRIRPLADGGYEIPEGNLFAPDGSQGRPEIYAMGCRNPFRISIDPRRGWLYWGDVGPDAGSPGEARGPAGHDEFNRAKQPGFFGWPLLIADNKPYRDFDFTTSISGPAFDAGAPIADSPNNTGAHALPPAQPAWIYYPYAKSEVFPELGDGSRTAMAGPTFYASGTRRAPTALPPSFDNSIFLYEWSRNWIIAAHLDESGEVLDLCPFMASAGFTRPMDLELGPDGCLYLIEWGTEFGGLNTDSTIARIDYFGTTARPPVADFATDVHEGYPPLAVAFDGSASRTHPEGGTLTYAWDFDGDGRADAAAPAATHTYSSAGSFDARLTVTDGHGRSSSTAQRITVGNTTPRVEVLWPPEGAFVAWGETINVRARAEDREAVEGSLHLVLATPALERPIASIDSLEGRFSLPGDPATIAEFRGAIALRAAARDSGNPPLEGARTVTLRPRRLETELFSTNSGTVVEAVTDPLGGVSSVAYIDSGDFVSYKPINFFGITALNFRIASATNGGTIEVRVDASDGPLLAEVAVPGTGGWQAWTDISTPIADPGGARELFLVFRGGEGALFNVNWMDAIGPGLEAAQPVPSDPE